MSLILSIETTTMTCSISLIKDDACWILKEQKDMGDHAQQLTIFIKELMQTADLPLSALDAIAVSKGPGSYTGLRIGVSVAKGLCFSLNKPLLAIDTLKSMAYAVQENHKVQSNDIIVSLQDARRMDAFAAVYDSDLNELKAPHFLTLEENSFQDLQQNEGKIWLCGNAAAKMPLAASNLVQSNIDGPSALFAEKLAANSFLSSNFEDLAYFEPFYLKPPNITKPKNNKYFKNR